LSLLGAAGPAGRPNSVYVAENVVTPEERSGMNCMP